jgi:hypothetical protein
MRISVYVCVYVVLRVAKTFGYRLVIIRATLGIAEYYVIMIFVSIGASDSRVRVLYLFKIKSLAALGYKQMLRCIGAKQIGKGKPIFAIGYEVVAAVAPQIRGRACIKANTGVVYWTVVNDAFYTVVEKSEKGANVFSKRVTADKYV